MMSYCNQCNTYDPCNYNSKPCNSCGCGDTCNECNSCFKCGPCNSTCKVECPVNIDTDCAYYLYSCKNVERESKMPCLGISKGTSLTDILEAIDTRLCAIDPTVNFSLFELLCLRETYVISDFSTYVEAVDTEICKIKESVTSIVNSDITNIINLVDSINVPNIPDCGTIGLLSTDTIIEVLTKQTQAICAIQSTTFTETSLSAINSQSVNFVTSGTSNHTLQASVNVAPGLNAISIVNGGLFAPVVTPSTQNTISECPTSGTILQVVTQTGNDFTICNEVDIPSILYGGGTDISNCLTLLNGKLFISCASQSNNNYVSNAALGPLIGGMMFTGVGTGFNGIVDLISSDTGNTLSYSVTDGKLFTNGASLQIDVNDTCPTQYLDPKFNNPIGTLVGTTGYGAHCGNVTIYGIPGAGVTGTRLTEIIIGGVGYPHITPLTFISNCQELEDALNLIFTNNNLPYSAWSNNSTVIAASQTECEICISGINSTTVVNINGEFLTLNLPNDIITPYSVPTVFSQDKIDPYYFNKVYKKIEDDGTGCKTISFYAHNIPPTVITPSVNCDAVNTLDITTLFYNPNDTSQAQILYLDISEPFVSGTKYIIEIEEVGEITLLSNYITREGLSLIPILNYKGGDLSITVKKDCGCCKGSQSASTTVLRTGSGVANGPALICNVPWTDVPPAAYVLGWGPSVNNGGLGLKYKIEGSTIYFKGGAQKIITFNPTFTIPGNSNQYDMLYERIILLPLLNTCVSTFLTSDVYQYGVTDNKTNLIRWDTIADESLMQSVVPHVLKSGAGIDVELYNYISPSLGITLLPVEVSLSSVVVRE